MYFKSLLLLISFFIPKTFATSICIKETPCKCIMSGGEVIDLSSVGTVGRPRFYEIQSNVSLYSYNPCYGFESSDKNVYVNEGNKPCKNAAACVRIPGDGDGKLPEEHALAIQDTARFVSIDGNAIQLNYTVPGTPHKLIVKLICDNSTLHHLTIDTSEDAGPSTAVMSLSSKCACPNQCRSDVVPEEPSGLSTGSKLLIAFFTILLAYFIIGIVWNCFNGAKGIEMVPNLDFWNELPKLIVEGVVFSCSCFGRKSSYGEV